MMNIDDCIIDFYKDPGSKRMAMEIYHKPSGVDVGGIGTDKAKLQASLFKELEEKIAEEED